MGISNQPAPNKGKLLGAILILKRKGEQYYEENIWN